MYNKNVLFVSLAALLSMFCSVASAGGSPPSTGGCSGKETPPCGTLTIASPKKGTATSFYSDLTSGASSAQNTGGLITDMKTAFNKAPFNASTLKFNSGTLDVANVGKGQNDIVTYTFLGASAANSDRFTVTGGAITSTNGNPFSNQTATPFGATITDTIKGTGSAETQLGFKFTDVTDNKFLTNGCSGSGIGCQGKFGILAGGYTIDRIKYADLLIYNDTGSSDSDYNDMVIGVNSICVSAVPEPETYAMLLAGLGLIGFIAYRRKNNSSNTLAA
jgi:hypothetical protein